jgi:OOP family OmpA-OmpF porin
MKRNVYAILLVTLLCQPILLRAQTPYTAGVALHAVNFKSEEYFTGENWQHNIPKVYLSAPFANRFSVMPSLALGNVTYPTNNNNDFFWDFDVSVKYDITETRLQPYLVAGIGLSSIKGVEEVNTILTPGVGINFWFSKSVGISAQTNYDFTLEVDDYFHNTIGLVFRFGGGPKDSDKDGIPDEKDACPKLAGVASAQGCPDADGDGVKDSDDQCPNEMGSAATQGCPDSDGDGVANAKDECPTIAGTVQFNGCPDTDGDGIADKNDACPSEKGTAQFNGCPDTDGDGIIDKDDRCPQVAGTAALQGCPDKDGDGVADGDDSCPDQAGTVSNKGCPEIKAEEVKAIETKLNVAAKQIQFETGSAKIKESSYEELDQIVTIMNQYTFTSFDIQGHTDNKGNLQSNKTLSQQRADAVKNYIAGKGISGDRLISTGYGPDRPIATNNTATGRAQNRRVEIHLKQ